LGTVSMNIPQSNHIAMDLGIPYMDTNRKYFPLKSRQTLDFQLTPNENFGLVQRSRRQRGGRGGGPALTEVKHLFLPTY
jgi:hypothetical protein